MSLVAFVLLACGGAPPPSGGTTDTSPPPTDPGLVPEMTCDALDVGGQSTDCTTLDFCDAIAFDVRLACCNCDPVYCNALGPAAAACHPACDPAPALRESLSCLATNDDGAADLSTEAGDSILVAGVVTHLGPSVPALDPLNEVSPEGCGGADVQVRFTDDDGNDWIVGWGIAGTDIEDESLEAFVVGERIEVELSRIQWQRKPYTLQVRDASGDWRFIDGEGTGPSVEPLIGWSPVPSVLCSDNDDVHMDMVATYQGDVATMRSGDVVSLGDSPQIRVVLPLVAYNPAPLTPFYSDWMAWRVLDPN